MTGSERKALIQRYAEKVWAIKGPDDLYTALGDMLYEYEEMLGVGVSSCDAPEYSDTAGGG